jgi:hypothetical protein
MVNGRANAQPFPPTFRIRSAFRKGIMYLTPHDTKHRETAVSDPSGDEAGAPEIEITPLMLRLGIAALCGYYREFDSEESAVTNIFRAMERGRRYSAKRPGLTGFGSSKSHK